MGGIGYGVSGVGCCLWAGGVGVRRDKGVRAGQRCQDEDWSACGETKLGLGMTRARWPRVELRGGTLPILWVFH